MVDITMHRIQYIEKHELHQKKTVVNSGNPGPLLKSVVQVWLKTGDKS
jgi:hypothetical protein